MHNESGFCFLTLKLPAAMRLAGVAAMSLFFLSGCVTTGDSAPKTSSTAPTTGPAGKGASEEYVKLLLAHGSRAHAAGDHDEAQSAYGRILQADPKNVHAALGLGESLLSTGDLPRSIKYFDAASKDGSLRATALQGQGIVLLKLGQYSGSESVLRQALKLDPKLWRAWNALGRTLDKSGKFEEAEKSYQAALKENPASAIVHNNSGVSYLLAGKYVNAEQAFRAAVTSDPKLKRARSNLRLAMAWQGKYAEAMTGVDRLELSTTLNNVGYIAMKRGDYRHAEAYFVQAKQSSPAFYDKADRNLKFLQQVRKLQDVAAQSRK